MKNATARLLVPICFCVLVLCNVGRVNASDSTAEERYHGPFRELPANAITPQGWLAEVLRRQSNGLTKHRHASGRPFDSDLWVGKIANAHWADYDYGTTHLRVSVFPSPTP